MRIAILFLLLTGLFTMSLYAQESKNSTVYSVEGKVRYSPEARGWFNYQQMEPGTRLSADGRIKVKKGASVAILQDGEYVTLTGKQRTTVAEVLGDARAFRDNDYISAFEAYVKDSEHPYFRQPEVLGFLGGNTEDPVASTESGPTKPPAKKSREGHQDPNAVLAPVSPNGTGIKPAKVAGQSTTFRWVPKKGQDLAASAYQLSILDSEGKVVWEKSVQGNTYEMDWTTLDIKPDAFYKWRASVSADPGKNTSNVPFQYIGQSTVDNMMQDLKSSDFYKSADPTAQLLIEAVALEEERLQAMAYERYERAVERSPRNELAVSMYKRFLWRYNGM